MADWRRARATGFAYNSILVLTKMAAEVYSCTALRHFSIWHYGGLSMEVLSKLTACGRDRVTLSLKGHLLCFAVQSQGMCRKVGSCLNSSTVRNVWRPRQPSRGFCGREAFFSPVARSQVQPPQGQDVPNKLFLRILSPSEQDLFTGWAMF